MNISVSDYTTGTLHIFMGVEFDNGDLSEQLVEFFKSKGFSMSNIEWFEFQKLVGVSE